MAPAPTPAPLPQEQEKTNAMLLTFRLEGELFALPVEHVHEILDPIEPTLVPLAPRHVPALVNVRGVIVPLVDIRHRLRMPPRTGGAAAGGAGRIVVIGVTAGGAPLRLAILADGVEAVVEADPAAFQPLPPLGSVWPEEFVAGGAQHECGFVVLLNVETIFDPTPGAARAA